ncbi:MULTISPECIES: acyl-CoA thioesterase [Psychrilyobacter]|uniref:YbgC/FadM family acyl-CoA thioesterase n=1 Tax=Psychrilyobacter piezotolerans TaxID=2293438 RepID=A0ABX9KHR3_9FUSO|nr:MULTISPECIES: thioesterase family protein [Psychrilyobacter]MCS5421466.1 acyl-CoA thioesterase [Psychrilyobacter sp. S5]NDI77782.1 acyl-CoA thioesterase [Psychrilyobacter piezotolerans]RDE62364.1 acyl-CoA thioesterase [Psychrilyobacter sp. S5]REI41462.1 YbgC/FadM family acyl-CoA thioesterase [Psychrilyobacter piezotolerans]
MEKSCHTIDHRVYYNETDQMGRVYHSNYVIWMEKGRTEFIRDKNLSYKSLEAEGIFLPVSDIDIKFLKAIEYDMEIKIKTILMDINRIKVKFRYEFYDSDMQTLFGIGNTTNIFVDGDGVPKRVGKELVEKIRS